MNAAAEELSVTPGAISRQVRQLEDSLHTTLFEGSKNKPRLTPSASALLPVLTAAFDQMEAAIQTISKQESGAIDVACFGTFAMKWLIPRLYAFNAQHPEMEIRLVTSRHATTTQALDLSIEVSDAAQANLAGMWPLFPERLGPVMAPALAKKFKLRSAKNWAGMPLLHTKTRLDAWQMWSDSAGLGLPTGAGTTFEHYYFTLEAAIGGLGVCIAPWHLVIDDIRNGRLVAPLGFQESAYTYVVRQCRPSSRKSEQFCRWLQKQAAQTPVP